LGVAISPFNKTSELEVTHTRQREFDVEREVSLFAAKLISDNSVVSARFQELTSSIRMSELGHFGVLPTQCVIWHVENWRRVGERLKEYTFYVFFGMGKGLSNGYWRDVCAVAKIYAKQTLMYGGEDRSELKSDSLTLRFEKLEAVSEIGYRFPDGNKWQ
jgi:hypothetical protein